MEDQFISNLRKRLERRSFQRGKLLRGLGDDAAVLERFGGRLAATVDLLSDGVDFIVGQTDPQLIGRKALAVNLSDLAAMAATPHSVLVSLLLPEKSPHGPTNILAEQLYEGMFPLLRQFHTALAGGDTNSWRGKLAISITAFGTVDPNRMFLRTGARPGDRIITTGRFGGSIHRRQFAFTPRVKEALYLSRYHKIHAALDVSDGLLLDLSRLAKESGVGFRLTSENVPIHPDVFEFQDSKRSGRRSQPTPLTAALGDGEDFELILAVPPKEAKRLLDEQPFLSLAKRRPRGRSSATSDMAKLCRERSLPWTDEDYRSPAELTDIGEFLPAEAGMSRTDPETGRDLFITQFSGWTHPF